MWWWRGVSRGFSWWGSGSGGMSGWWRVNVVVVVIRVVVVVVVVMVVRGGGRGCVRERGRVVCIGKEVGSGYYEERNK